MNKLLNQLYAHKLIKPLSDETTWNCLQIYDFVEVQGKMVPNPISDSFKKIYEMMELIIKISSIDLKDGKYNHEEVENFKAINELIKPIYQSLEKENSQKYILEINSEYKCILNLFNECIRDKTGLELPYGNFKILGKVIKKSNNGEEINLLNESPVSFNDNILDTLLNTLKSLNNELKIPKIETTINCRCIQIIPIAIFI